MKPTLQVRLSQHLTLTPQLQQAIRLLQLSTLELTHEIHQMLEQNPFLETDDEAPSEEPAHERVAAAEHQANSDEAETRFERGDSDEDAPGVDSVEFGVVERSDWENGTEQEDFDGITETPGPRAGDGDSDDTDSQRHTSVPETLQEHLRAQVCGMRLSPEDAGALAALLDSLNDDGYLGDPLEEIAERLAGDEEALREELLERLQCALKWLQGLEPVGVGARDLSECLILQLRSLARSQAQMIAILICRQHLGLLARRDIKRLMSLTGADEELLLHAQALIVSLEPKPGRRFARTQNTTVVPDVIVHRVGHNWKAALNPDVLPKLRINDAYAQAIRGAGGRSTPMRAHLQEARWFMKNIMRRFDTIQRVSQAIVDHQRNFFAHGAIAMKPLRMSEIAAELELNESTISRVTTAKYMATPLGTFELKHFFGASVKTQSGGSASSTAVQALVAQLVANENPAQPLPDRTLSLLLEEQGIKVARRTVTKYREGLKIAPASLRKSK